MALRLHSVDLDERIPPPLIINEPKAHDVDHQKGGIMLSAFREFLRAIPHGHLQ